MYHADRACFLCGRNGTEEPLEKHHIFNGPYRKQSERFGLTVYLCAHSCHNGGENSVHINQTVDRRLKQYGQLRVMQENDWDVKDFINMFGKNYLDEDPEDGEPPMGAWRELVITDEELPY